MGNTENQSISVYAYGDYRKFLKEFLEAEAQAGRSFRSYAKAAGFSSPNYLQRILTGDRKLTVKSATKVAAAIGLEGNQAKYFIGMIALEDPQSDKDKVLDTQRRLVKESLRTRVKDISITSHWLHGSVFEMANLQEFDFTLDNLHERLGKIASRQEIQDSMKFLLDRQWLVPTGQGQQHRQNDIRFDVITEVRRIELQRWHLRFLELAKHRINDDLKDRSFHGLTMAIPLAKMPLIKQRIEQFVTDLRTELDGSSPLETVVHVECCLFKLAAEPQAGIALDPES